MKRDIKLYNLIFPMWGIYFYAILFPYFFVLLLPANFIVDTVMLLLLFFLFKVPEKKELYRKGIWTQNKHFFRFECTTDSCNLQKIEVIS